jgi:2-succinyl-6-hydroxy-2,4-cyclohexadiene-1-carboxylate synthase
MLHFEQSGSAENPPLLFLHGFMGINRDWSPVINQLSDQFHCIAVDLPGHGQSQFDDPALFSMPAAAGMVIELLGYLEIDAVALVGYSMGGRLALYLAVHFPEHFTSLILESASPGLRTAEERQTRQKWDASIAHKLETQPLPVFLDDWYAMPLFNTLRSHPNYGKVRQRRLANDPTQLALSMRQMGTGSQPSLWDEWVDLAVPTLLLAGELDQKYVGISAEMHTLNPRAHRVIIPNAGHNTHFEQNQAFSDEVGDWLLSRQGQSKT